MRTNRPPPSPQRTSLGLRRRAIGRTWNRHARHRVRQRLRTLDVRIAALLSTLRS